MNPPQHDHPVHHARATDGAAEDMAVIRRIAGGDEMALAALYDRWVQSVYSLVVHLLRDADEAEDVVEDVFWQVWQHAPSFDPTRSTPTSWILTIARGSALGRLRSRARPQGDVFDDIRIVRDVGPNTSLDAEGAERRDEVLGALDELPDDQRQVLDLAYSRGLRHREIAELLGEPLSVVQTRMWLAMQKLRERLVVPRGDAA